MKKIQLSIFIVAIAFLSCFAYKYFKINQNYNLVASNDKSFMTNISKNTIENYSELFNTVFAQIKVNYVEDVEDKKLFEDAINGMLSSLDPHSNYLNKKSYDEMKVHSSGKFGGVGIQVTMENKVVKVIAPIEGTPAYKAGIKSGDYITKIDEKSVFGMTLEEAVSHMRGDVNTKLTLTVLREKTEKPLIFKLKREFIKTSEVRGHREGDIAYVRIPSFVENTYSEVIKVFNSIQKDIGKDNIKGFILDLRGNPGGLLDQSVLISDLFLNKEQNIVSIKYKNTKQNETYVDKRDEDFIKGVPMAVIIDEGSASASEIVAGALQDNKRAIILGQKSFGKGSVQSIIPIKNGGAIKMTVARYYTPSGRSIQAEGVVPNILVSDAKIEEVESKSEFSEASLNGHLEKEINDTNNIEQIKGADKSLYEKDYQLARAVDLLLGISFYNSIAK